MTDQNQQAGLIGAHANYVAGAAQQAAGATIQTGAETLGTSGAEYGQSLQNAGLDVKDKAVKDMKAAGEQRDANAQGYGQVEQFAGKVAGCEGMEQEGAQSKTS